MSFHVVSPDALLGVRRRLLRHVDREDPIEVVFIGSKKHAMDLRVCAGIAGWTTMAMSKSAPMLRRYSAACPK
jgi:hypothetical protein